MTSSMIILRQPTFKAQKNKSSEIDNDLRILMRHKRVVEQRVSHQQSFEIVQKLLAVSVCSRTSNEPFHCWLSTRLHQSVISGIDPFHPSEKNTTNRGRNLLPIDCFIDSDLNAIANDQSSLVSSSSPKRTHQVINPSIARISGCITTGKTQTLQGFS